MKIVLFGPPGAGKGTQASSISNKYSIPHISTGDIFRNQISKMTPIGIEAKKYIDQGLLVPDEITTSIVIERLIQNDCKKGFLLDGYPRNLNQAEALGEFLLKNNDNLDTALLIDVSKEFILERMTGRRVCLSCGASYHIKFNPPKIEGKCDACGNELIQRKDDNEVIVKERFEVYYKQTESLIKYYKDKGILSVVDGTKAINDVFKSISNVLGAIIND